MIIVCINERFNMLGCSRSRHTIHHFRFIRVEKAMSYLSDVYDALITEIDFYAMNVSLLIGRESFEIDKTGQLEVNPEGVAVACERNRKSSTWAFDRIMYYKSRNEMSPPTLKEMLRLTKREWYRIRAIEEEESLMSFYYALGKLIETIEEADSKESEDNLSEFIRHSIRRIKAKYENKQCHVRDRLCELANLINLPAEAECLAERHEQP
jgi:hypothetical protein